MTSANGTCDHPNRFVEARHEESQDERNVGEFDDPFLLCLFFPQPHPARQQPVSFLSR